MNLKRAVFLLEVLTDSVEWSYFKLDHFIKHTLEHYLCISAICYILFWDGISVICWILVISGEHFAKYLTFFFFRDIFKFKCQTVLSKSIDNLHWLGIKAIKLNTAPPTHLIVLILLFLCQALSPHFVEPTHCVHVNCILVLLRQKDAHRNKAIKTHKWSQMIRCSSDKILTSITAR